MVAARTVTVAQVVDAVRVIAWTTDAQGRRKLAAESLYGRRKTTADLRGTVMPEASADFGEPDDADPRAGRGAPRHGHRHHAP